MVTAISMILILMAQQLGTVKVETFCRGVFATITMPHLGGEPPDADEACMAMNFVEECQGKTLADQECSHAVDAMISDSTSIPSIARTCHLIYVRFAPSDLVARYAGKYEEAALIEAEKALECYDRLDVCVSREHACEDIDKSTIRAEVRQLKETRNKVIEYKIKAKAERKIREAKDSFIQWLDD